jgi:DNA-binding winged helix-turn-helix (wHTH) protein
MTVQLGFGDFELDEARFELRRSGESVTVQPKVLELIFYLAKNRQRVVSKNELFETIWDGTAVTEASLSQAVSLARKALGDSPREQLAIRTVRGRGLQFVAEARSTAGGVAKGDAVKRQRPPRRGGTELETAQDEARRSSSTEAAAHLFAALHGEFPGDGGASWSLGDVDEVHIVRGSRRKTKREPGLLRLLTITIPGRLLSRQHARIVRASDGWLVVDEGSRNGTFVNGERVQKCDIVVGDLIECGRTVFRFGESAIHHVAEDADSLEGSPSILATVTPRLLGLEQELLKIAPSDLPVLLLGESGTGKSHLAGTLHELSGRAGALTTLAAASLSDAAQVDEKIEHAIAAAHDGSIVIEGLERVDDNMAPALSTVLESAPHVRVICTSMIPFATLEQRVPRDLLTRLSGYRCDMPPLRQRLGDLGALVGALLPEHEGSRGIEPAAALALLRHRWPGNLRELAHLLQAACIVAGAGTIRLEHLPAELRTA